MDSPIGIRSGVQDHQSDALLTGGLDVEHIKECARRRFSDNVLIEFRDPNTHQKRLHFIKPEYYKTTLGVILDSGLLFMSTIEDLMARWSEFTLEAPEGYPFWLQQMATSFRVEAFNADMSLYRQWVNYLAMAYSAHSTSLELDDGSTLDPSEYACIHDDFLDRLPQFKEFRRLLFANNWMVYLLTLELSVNELLKLQLKDELETPPPAPHQRRETIHG